MLSLSLGSKPLQMGEDSVWLQSGVVGDGDGVLLLQLGMSKKRASREGGQRDAAGARAAGLCSDRS